MRRCIVTGAAGFIGSHVCEHLLASGWNVLGIDNFDGFYPRPLKEANIAQLLSTHGFRLAEVDICNCDELSHNVAGEFDAIIHLAAKAGVRPSIRDPLRYQQVNVGGTQNVLELARNLRVPQFVFASSSSVYGVNPNVPWREDDHVLLPISPYASTKVSGELLGHVYSHLYGLRFLALRFFTVYGPRQRPDLAIHKFARLLSAGQPIPVYGDGTSCRDYTYIGDIAAGIVSALSYTTTRYEVINLGNHVTVSLLALIHVLENSLNIHGQVVFQGSQPGDVPQTYADISKARRLLDYHPVTDIETGIGLFVEWLRRKPSGQDLPLHRKCSQP